MDYPVIAVIQPQVRGRPVTADTAATRLRHLACRVIRVSAERSLVFQDTAVILDLGFPDLADIPAADCLVIVGIQEAVFLDIQDSAQYRAIQVSLAQPERRPPVAIQGFQVIAATLGSAVSRVTQDFVVIRDSRVTQGNQDIPHSVVIRDFHHLDTRVSLAVDGRGIQDFVVLERAGFPASAGSLDTQGSAVPEYPDTPDSVA